MSRAALTTLALGLAMAHMGCVDRKIRVTSTPPGALVHLNDVELGRTPVEADFTFYGEYDVRLTLEGHEPLVTSREAKAPIHEWPGIDLVATALPIRFDNTVEWHFDLVPALEQTQDPAAFEAGLLERASELRGQLAEPADG